MATKKKAVKKAAKKKTATKGKHKVKKDGPRITPL